MIDFDIGLDLFPLTAAILACVSCAVLGNFLVLRRLSLMGDAISHSVLPGLVIAFMLSASRSPAAMFLGAACAALATVGLVEVVKRFGRVEPGAAMGVVFSLLFAIGVLLIEQAAVRHVDLDADCVLHGQLEALAWFGAPQTWTELIDGSTLSAVPRQVWVLGVVVLTSLAAVTLFFKELRLAAFDPALATAQGYSASLMHAGLMTLVAIATVAAFEAVGSILVIAMLICPAVTARLVTDRLAAMLCASVFIAILTAVLGYLGATWVPALFEQDAVNAAGSIAVVSGLLLALTVLLSPSHGLLWNRTRRLLLARSIEHDDLLAALYRLAEIEQGVVPLNALAGVMNPRSLRRAVRIARSHGHITEQDQQIRLTTAGLARAQSIVRRHRLWESYLVEKAGVAPDHVHATAEMLEHIHLAPSGDASSDPHGRVIPPEPAP